MNRLRHVMNHIEEPSLQSEETATRKIYECTLDQSSAGVLTQEQRDFYEENGYLVIRNLLSPEDIEKYWTRFDQIVADPDERREEMTVMRDVSERNMAKREARAVTKLQVWARDPVLWDFACHPGIIKYTQAFTGPDVRAMHFMVINKPPDVGTLSSRQPLHQDQWFFPFGPSDRIVCAWTALQHVYRENGCLCVVPGTHKQEPFGKLVRHEYPPGWNGRINKAYHAVKVDDVSQFIRRRKHLEMNAGDTVFFHPLLVHGSGSNLTEGFRRSISIHYCGSNNGRYMVHTKDQEDIGREQERMARLKGISFIDIWKYKSRQVTGLPRQLGHNIPEGELQKDFCGAVRKEIF